MRLSALLLVAPALLAAQQAATKELSAPTWTSAEGFSGVRRIRELSDGRVLMIDYKDNRILLISAKGETMGDIGRVGGGPGEYQQPIELLSLGGDSTAVTDQGLRRILFLDGTPKPVGTTLFPPELISSLVLTRGADAKGRFYFTKTWVSSRPDGAAETLPILAWDRASNRVDTVGSFLAAKQITQEIDFGGGSKGRATFPVRFVPADEWALLSTGEIGILHSDPYSMDVLRDGKVRVRGASIPFERIKVEESERLPKAVAKEIPEFKPAFGSNGSALAGPAGDLWMLRSLAPSATTRVYDRFDSSAKRIGSFTLPRAIIVVGFGRNSVYTVRTDADGLQWLEKRPMPR